MLQVNLLPLLQRIQLPCVQWAITAKLREAFLFQVPNSFGIFLNSFAILKNPFANPLKKVANLLMEFANCNVPKLININVSNFLFKVPNFLFKVPNFLF